MFRLTLVIGMTFLTVLIQMSGRQPLTCADIISVTSGSDAPGVGMDTGVPCETGQPVGLPVRNVIHGLKLSSVQVGEGGPAWTLTCQALLGG